MSTRKIKTETNSTVYNRLKRKELRCPLCPPNKGENKKQHKKYVSKPKEKS